MKDEQMSEVEVPEGTEVEKSGFKSIPARYKWPKGKSGNPEGGRRRKRSSLRTALAERLCESQVVPSGRRKERLTLKQSIVRGLLENAATGNKSALLAVIKLHEEGDANATPLTGPSITMCYSDAAAAHGSDALDEAFYQEMDRKLAAWKREDNRRDASFRALIDRELRRKVPATKDTEPVMVPLQDVIVATFLRKANAGDVAIIKMLLKIVPEKKKPKKDRWRVHVLRPLRSELEWMRPNDPENWPGTRPESDDRHLYSAVNPGISMPEKD
jgi:hypothetical protein